MCDFHGRIREKKINRSSAKKATGMHRMSRLGTKTNTATKVTPGRGDSSRILQQKVGEGTY